MSRLIDADWLIDNIERRNNNEIKKYGYAQSYWLTDFIGMLKYTPQLEGEWLKVSIEGWDLKKRPMIRCSHCGWTFSVALNPRNYCPSCGTRMDGEEE